MPTAPPGPALLRETYLTERNLIGNKCLAILNSWNHAIHYYVYSSWADV